MLFSKQTPAAGGTAFAQFDAAWAYDGNGYILNDTGTSLDVRIGASGSVITLPAGGTLPIKLVNSMAELYVRRTDQATTQVTVKAQVGTGSAGGGGSTADMGVIAAAAAAAAVAGLKTELPIEQRTTVPVVFIGDSFTDGQKTYPWTYSPTSYANQAAFYGAGRVAMINNAGVAGETAAQILARVDADLIAFNPRYGVVLAGTNDCVVGSEVASTMTSLVEAYRKILAAGIEPIAVTIAPIAAEPANTLATALNVEIRRVATELGVRLFDLWAFVRDPATGKIKASYAADSIHLNELGAHDTGLAFLEALAFPKAVPGFLPVLVTDTGIRSDLFVDSNSDGIPDGWADGNTSVGMTFTCTGGVWTSTTTGANALVYLCSLGAAPAAGTRLALAFKISIIRTDPAFAPQLYLQTSTGGTENNLRPFTNWTMGMDDATVYVEWEVPATPGDMTLVLYAPDGAAGQIQLSKLRLFEPRS